MTTTALQLRSTHWLLCIVIVAAAGGCGFELPTLPGAEGDASAGEAGESGGSSTSGDASATSTTGRPPATSSTTLDPSTSIADDTTDVGDTGGAFIPDPTCGIADDDEFAARCRPVECSVVAQECPEGEKCVPWANDGGNQWNANRCAPLPEDPAALGEPCLAEGSPVSGIDDCERGALCFGVDPRTLQGTCVALCDGEEPAACPDGEVCVAEDSFAPQVCMPRCDPTDPATCAADEGCRQIGGEILCVPTVALPQGLSCGTADQHCAVEQACVSAEALAECAEPACCTAWCDLLAPDPDLACAAVPGEVCRPYFEPAPVGQEHVGVCALPG